MTTGKYLNTTGFEIPDNKILVVPYGSDPEEYSNVIKTLKGNTQRDWFTPHFYYCLPLTIGNQYGFGLYSLLDFEVIWDGEESPESTKINILSEESDIQTVCSHFGSGVISVNNSFHLKTPPRVNLITVQPPNYFIPGLSVMTGVVETDNIRRDFTFSIKVTIPNQKISVKKGDLLCAFLPIERGFVDKFDIEPMSKYFSEEFYENEMGEAMRLNDERVNEDVYKNHLSGRRYFSGTHTDGTKYLDHQKRLN